MLLSKLLIQAILYSAVAGVGQYLRWGRPVGQASHIYKRESGYHPEFGDCGTGVTCSEACGNGFEACSSSLDLVLFCFNSAAGQTCCPNGQGRACDTGFYCAQDLAGETWCCAKHINLADCAASHNLPALFSQTSSIASNPTNLTPEPVDQTTWIHMTTTTMLTSVITSVLTSSTNLNSITTHILTLPPSIFTTTVYTSRIVTITETIRAIATMTESIPWNWTIECYLVTNSGTAQGFVSSQAATSTVTERFTRTKNVTEIASTTARAASNTTDRPPSGVISSTSGWNATRTMGLLDV